MKNIRFYEAEKYNSSDYEKIEDMIYKTKVQDDTDSENYAFRQCPDAELAAKLKGLDEWKPGSGDFIEDFMVLSYQGKKYYREIENIGTDEDIVFENQSDDSGEPKYTYVTSLMFVQEPEFGEDEPSSEYVSQYPLEDILDEFYIYCYDSYDRENASDKENSYVEFAGDEIEDIRKVLTLIGKHVYNKQEGEYVKLIIE